MPGHRSTQFFRKFAKNLPTLVEMDFALNLRLLTPDGRPTTTLFQFLHLGSIRQDEAEHLLPGQWHSKADRG